MIVLGLDPGTRICGFAVLEISLQKSMQVLEIGAWSLGSSAMPLGQRLDVLAQSARALLRKHNPRFIGFERAVYHRNVASAMTLSEARGVLRQCIFSELDAADERLREYTPTQVKRMGGGSGASTKFALKKTMERRFSGLQETVSFDDLPFDALDALAVAFTCYLDVQRGHIHWERRSGRLQDLKEKFSKTPSL